ncbi:hypothetical protein QOZ99_003668 [Angulomicrobium amanitiforme]|uniref:Uncharacterized protein n=1 Tax=Ancylobacter amanitiformis TaxID=217069 RepID=A0ABU0LVQ9_9HYPH|nr:hypothetical protein [Ancylobacter amanitiformis]
MLAWLIRVNLRSSEMSQMPMPIRYPCGIANPPRSPAP